MSHLLIRFPRSESQAWNAGYRGHSCKHLLIGDESVICRKEKGNKCDHHAVAITRNNVAVERVPQNICDHA